MGKEAYQTWKSWIWHKSNCRVVGIGDHLHASCTCGLAAKLEVIGVEDPREKGLDREDVAALG